MVSTIKDPLTFNDLMAILIYFSKYVLNGLKIENLSQDILLGPAFYLLKGTCSSSNELEYNFQEFFNELIDKLDWNNPEGDHYPFDLSKPLPLQGPLGHRTIAADYFFNNDLEYMKTSNPESTIKHAYDKDDEKGIKHWGERRKLWYQSQVSKFSKHNVYSTKAILGVKSVSVKKLHGYGYLEEIVVKRSDQQLYMFKEGDFVDLHLNDIEDMLLLAVQHKLFHLDRSVIVDFIVVLPDDLYKFSDGTLKFVRDEIHHRVLDFRLNYNPEMLKRKWTALDRKRSGLMIELIDKQLREREIVKNLDYKVVRIRSKSENKGIVPTEMELVLEQIQQGTSHEVSISTEGVEELKRKDKIKGEKKEALLSLRQKPATYGDVNISLTNTEPTDKEKDDEEMTVAGHVNINEEGADNQVKDDAQATQKIEVPRNSTLLTILVFVIPEHTIDNPPEIVTTTSITNLEKDVKELKTVNHYAALLSTIKSKVPNDVKECLGTSLDDALHKVLQKHSANITKEQSVPAYIIKRLKQQYVPEKSTKDIRKIKMEHARQQQVPKETIISYDTIALTKI
ncbi:hypothetical protein Tco_1450237 [Tanacetum coccineum]